MKDRFIEKLVNYAERNENVILLTGDLGKNCIEPFIKRFPKRYFNMGSCEQNMIGVAGGLAIQGFKVFVYSIANFASMRCLEHLRNIVNYYNLDVNIIAVGAGLEYSLIGYSHLAIEDAGIIKNLSNFEIYEPATTGELDVVCGDVFGKKHPKYIRLNKGVVENNITKGLEPNLVAEGGNIGLFCTGNIVKEVLEAKNILKIENIDVSVYSCPCVKRLNSVKLKQKLKEFKQVFTIEEHLTTYLGESFADILSQISNAPILTMIGVDNIIFEAVGTKDYLKQNYQLDVSSICNKIKVNLKN